MVGNDIRENQKYCHFDFSLASLVFVINELFCKIAGQKFKIRRFDSSKLST